MFSNSYVKQTKFLQNINVFKKSFQMSGHMAKFIQYFNSIIFVQIISQVILFFPQFIGPKKWNFP